MTKNPYLSTKIIKNGLKIEEKQDYLLIKYENLIDNSVEVFSNILKFYNYPLDIDKIKKSVEINSKEITLNKLKGISIKKIRFTDPKKLEDTKSNPIIRDFFEKAKRFWKN